MFWAFGCTFGMQKPHVWRAFGHSVRVSRGILRPFSKVSKVPLRILRLGFIISRSMENTNEKPNAVNVVRIGADSGVFNSPQDAETLAGITLRPRDDVRLDISLLNRKRVVDASDIDGITLEIFDIGAQNAPDPRAELLLVEKSVAASEINKDLDDGAYSNGGCHASVLLDSSDTALASGPKWLKICARTSGGMRTTFAQGWISIDRGVGEAPSNATGRDVYLKAEDAENFLKLDAADGFLAKAQNLGDVLDKPAARQNLGILSADETEEMVDGKLSAFEPVPVDVAELTKNMERLGKDAQRTRGVLLQNGKIIIPGSENFFAELPLTFCLTYETDAFIIGTQQDKMLSFFSNWRTVNYKPEGLRLAYFDGGSGVGKRLLLQMGNSSVYADGGELQAEFDLSPLGGELPAGKHSIVCAIGGKIEGGKVGTSLYLDGELLPIKSTTYNSLRSVYVGSEAPMQINTCVGDSTVEIGANATPISISRFKVFNADLSEEVLGYSAKKYALGYCEPQSMAAKTFSPRCVPEEMPEDGFQFNSNISRVSYVDGILNATCKAGQKDFTVRHNFAGEIAKGTLVEAAVKITPPAGASGKMSAIVYYADGTSTRTVMDGIDARLRMVSNGLVTGVGIRYLCDAALASDAAMLVEKMEVRVVGTLADLSDSPDGIQLYDHANNGMHGVIVGNFVSYERRSAFSEFGEMSWSASAETKNFLSYTASVPENCCLKIFARADSAVTANFGNGESASAYAASKSMPAGQWVCVAENAFNGASKKITVTPGSAYSGKIRLAVRGEYLS